MNIAKHLMLIINETLFDLRCHTPSVLGSCDLSQSQVVQWSGTAEPVQNTVDLLTQF